MAYLHGPLSHGVFVFQFIADFQGVKDYLAEVLAEHEKAAAQEGSAPMDRLRVQRFGETLQELNKIRPGGSRFEGIGHALSDMANFRDASPQLRQAFQSERRTVDSSGRPISYHLRRSPIPDIFGSRANYFANELVHVDRKSYENERYRFVVTTLMKEGQDAFKRDLECLPPVVQSLEVIKTSKQYSSRYVFRPYPLAVETWLRDDGGARVPSDISEFLTGAVRYIDSGEWRTSVILSAIAVESLLADLYEESYKKPAPNVPLGKLLKDVKKRTQIPRKILAAVELANKARIAAVHRSRLAVSDKDAINALFGAANFVDWFCGL